MDSINLLTEPVTWRTDLFADDLPRPVCEGRLKITRAEGSNTLNAPLLALADALATCFERCVLTGENALEYLWDSGEKVKVALTADAHVLLELPAGAEPLRITKQNYTEFVVACYSRALSEVADHGSNEGMARVRNGSLPPIADGTGR
jgi:hypothetical protein